MKTFIAYYRVSTDRQGRSGLGLDAQAAAVTGFVAGAGQLAATFTEIESGKANDRPQLALAIAAARKAKATLVIAKLDRLSRNVAFIATLMDAGVDFVAVDNPNATRLTLHILAAVAEHERAMISERTRAGVTAARRRGVRFGRKPKLSPTQVAHARQLIESGRRVQDVAALLSVGRVTLYRALRRKAQA